MIHALALIWNPSDGIQIGFFTLHFYSLMFLIAFGTGWFIMKKIYDRENESVEKLDKLFIYTIAATLVGARLGHVFFYDWNYFAEHPEEILLPFRFSPKFEYTGFTGLASHGAAIAVILVVIWYSRKIIHKPVFWLLDRIVIPVSSGGVFVRLGNFFNSEITGRPVSSTFPTAIKFVRDEDNLSRAKAMSITGKQDYNQAYDLIEKDPRFSDILAAIPYKHPAQLYEAAGYIVVFIILYYMYWKTNARTKPGLIFGIFLALLWTVRFCVEFVKASQGGFEGKDPLLLTGQWLSIPFILVGFFIILSTYKKKPTFKN